MPITCPRCGTRSAAVSESCRECGRDLYRVSYPAPAAFRLSQLRGSSPRQIAVVAVLVLVGAGISAGVLLQGGENEGPTSQERLPATAVPREPTPSAPPSTPEPTESKAPAKPAPSTTQPSSTPSATPTPTGSPSSVPDQLRDAERALEFAREVRERWWHGSGEYGPGYGSGDQGSGDHSGDYDYGYNYDYYSETYDSGGYYE